MKRGSVFLIIGALLCFCAIVVAWLTFFPVIKEEVRFQLMSRNISAEPIDSEFGIVIPKLGANARIIADVNPYDRNAYQQALTRGVAHARGTVYPGQIGNIFLFSHSSVDFYVAAQYNSIFYLISKLEKGDTIDLYYHGNKYSYSAIESHIVNSSATQYLTVQTDKKRVTLMTCWPPGTTLKRLLVIGELQSP